METLKQFLAERKWYDAYLFLENLSENQYTDELIDTFLNTMFPIASQVYPLSLTQTVIKITKNYSSRLDALIELEKKINSSVFKDQEHKDSLILIKIAIYQNLFENGKDVEKEIYELKKMDLTDEQEEMFNLLALKYFEKSQNYNEAYLYSKRLGMKEKMINYAIHAENVYFLPKIENEPEHFKAVREGNFNYIKKYKTDNHQFVLQKTYIIRILESCRNKKKVDISELSKLLQLNRIIVLKLIIKALSLNLMKGKINGEEDIFELSHVSLQTVTKENLVSMKEKFETWRDRVDEVIEAME